MNRTIAIGDIHGCIHTFKQLLLEEVKLQLTDTVYCLGDYIDRGDNSKQVIDFIMELRAAGYTIHTLRGNHEQLMMDSGKSQADFERWTMNGGHATLRSFGITSYHELEPVYKEFFNRTEFLFHTDDYFFTHAGLNFKHRDPFEDTHAMLWIRDFEVDLNVTGKRVLIHGHTPKPLSFVLSQQGNPSINIDAGCVYRNKPGLGHLVAYNCTNQTFIAVPNTHDNSAAGY